MQYTKVAHIYNSLHSFKIILQCFDAADLASLQTLIIIMLCFAIKSKI